MAAAREVSTFSQFSNRVISIIAMPDRCLRHCALPHNSRHIYLELDGLRLVGLYPYLVLIEIACVALINSQPDGDANLLDGQPNSTFIHSSWRASAASLNLTSSDGRFNNGSV